jgi:hypothetical protein
MGRAESEVLRRVEEERNAFDTPKRWKIIGMGWSGYKGSGLVWSGLVCFCEGMDIDGGT